MILLCYDIYWVAVYKKTNEDDYYPFCNAPERSFAPVYFRLCHNDILETTANMFSLLCVGDPVSPKRPAFIDF